LRSALLALFVTLLVVVIMLGFELFVDRLKMQVEIADARHREEAEDLPRKLSALQLRYDELSDKLKSPHHLALLLAEKLAASDSLLSNNQSASATSVEASPPSLVTDSAEQGGGSRSSADSRSASANVEASYVRVDSDEPKPLSAPSGRIVVEERLNTGEPFVDFEKWKWDCLYKWYAPLHSRLVLGSGARIIAGHWLRSCNAEYRLIMQSDHQLVLCKLATAGDVILRNPDGTLGAAARVIKTLLFGAYNVLKFYPDFDPDASATFLTYDVSPHPASCSLSVCLVSHNHTRHPICTRYVASDIDLRFDPQCVAAYASASPLVIDRDCGAIRLTDKGHIAATSRP
jgi:hypothetical protein